MRKYSNKINTNADAIKICINILVVNGTFNTTPYKTNMIYFPIILFNNLRKMVGYGYITDVSKTIRTI